MLRSKDVSIWPRLGRLRPMWFQVSRCYIARTEFSDRLVFYPISIENIEKTTLFILNNCSYFKIILDLFTYSKLF